MGEEIQLNLLKRVLGTEPSLIGAVNKILPMIRKTVRKKNVNWRFLAFWFLGYVGPLWYVTREKSWIKSKLEVEAIAFYVAWSISFDRLLLLYYYIYGLVGLQEINHTIVRNVESALP